MRLLPRFLLPFLLMNGLLSLFLHMSIEIAFAIAIHLKDASVCISIQWSISFLRVMPRLPNNLKELKRMHTIDFFWLSYRPRSSCTMLYNRWWCSMIIILIACNKTKPVIVDLDCFYSSREEPYIFWD